MLVEEWYECYEGNYDEQRYCLGMYEPSNNSTGGFGFSDILEVELEVINFFATRFFLIYPWLMMDWINLHLLYPHLFLTDFIYLALIFPFDVWIFLSTPVILPTIEFVGAALQGIIY